MAHMIEEGIDMVYTPAAIPGDKQSEMFADTWHGLQTELTGGIQLDGSNIEPVFCPIVEGKLAITFDGKQLDIPEGSMDFPENKALVADCRKGLAGKMLPLHVPKNGYKVHQNRTLFDAMVKSIEKVLGAGNFQIVTVGTLGGYSQFFISIAIKSHDSFEVGKLANGAADDWKMFFNLNSSHNGLIASNRMLSTVRMVCMNTVQMSIADAEARGTNSVIKHTLNSENLITPAAFEADLKQWLARGETFKATLEYLKAQPMTIEHFQFFTAGVFTNEKTDELSTTSYNRIQDMTALFTKGKGNDGASRYDAVNAFTEYFTSGKGTGDDVSPAKRAAMANFGRGNDWKQQAIQDAAPIDAKTGKPSKAAFERLISRGRTLYNDKHAVVMAGN